MLRVVTNSIRRAIGFELVERELQEIKTATSVHWTFCPTQTKRPIECLTFGDTQISYYADDYMAQLIRDTTPDFSTTEQFLSRFLEKYNGHIHYIDVGCNFGIDLLLLTKFLRPLAKKLRVSAFDPGAAADLVPENIRANNLQSQIDFRPLAISDSSKRIEIFGEKQTSLNNSTIQMNEDSSVLWESEATSLDDYFSATDSSLPAFIKIDTQGGEPGVFKGLKHTIASAKPLLVISEFTPWLMARTLDPVEYLAGHFEAFDMYDLGPQRDRLDRVAIETAPEFVENISRSAAGWTDLLMFRPHDSDILAA